MELLSRKQPDFPLSNKKSTFEDPNILNSNAKTKVLEANWFTSSNYKEKVGIYSKFTDIFLRILSNNFNLFSLIFSETCESHQNSNFSLEKELISLTKEVLLDSLNQLNDIISVYDLKKTVLLQDVTGLNYKLISKLTSIVMDLEEFLHHHKEKWVNPIEKPYKTLKNWFIVSTDLFQRFVREINFNLRLFDPKSNITQKLRKSRQLLSILVMLIEEISLIFTENSNENLITLIINYKIQEINDLENIVQRLGIEKIKSTSPLSLFQNFNFVLKPSNLTFIDSAKDKEFLCNVANKYKKISVMRFAEISQQENKRKNFVIEMPDFFKGNCQYKYIHYFKPFSKFLILFDISMIQKEINLDNGNYMKIPLNISFDLAYDNKSLITPDGEIFLSSGKFSEKGLFKPDDSFFLLDYEHVTLVEQQKMPIAKKFHAMNYLKRCIFIVGGKTDERKCTSECEKYEITTKKWRKIANLNEPVTYPSVTPFGDKYVFFIIIHYLSNLFNIYFIFSLFIHYLFIIYSIFKVFVQIWWYKSI